MGGPTDDISETGVGPNEGNIFSEEDDSVHF